MENYQNIRKLKIMLLNVVNKKKGGLFVVIRKVKLLISIILAIFILTIANTSYASTLSSDVNSLDDSKYPGIKSMIQSLQKSHPSWKFQIEYTGLEFDDVILNECQGHGVSPRNLSPAFNNSYSGSWICPICGQKLYDSEKWYCASEMAVKYMIDPRNSLNENDVFQFLDLSYTDNSTINKTVAEADMNISNSYFELNPDLDINAIKQKYATAVIKNADGSDITSGIIGTGDKITIDNQTYTLIKKGDVTKDGLVNIVDVVNMLNSITGKVQLDEEAKIAGKIQGTGNISIVDVVNVLNYITGKQKIKIQTETVSNNTNDMASCVENMAKNIAFLDDECIQAVMDASNKYKINPLYLLARLYQEQGAGNSPLANGSGQDGSYVGIYNLFNINAFGNSKANIIKNGLSFANSKGWTSKAKSIEGGAEIIANSYISKNQDTLYYQKFNVVGTSGLYTHQYMQNILAAQTEGETLRKTYKSVDSNLTNTYVFTIPVYENMPKEACSRPDTNNPIQVNIVEKTVSVESSLKVRTNPTTSSDLISTLKNGYTVKVLKTTDEAIDGHKWSLIVCEATGAYGYVADEYLN